MPDNLFAHAALTLVSLFLTCWLIALVVLLAFCVIAVAVCIHVYISEMIVKRIKK